MDFDHPEGKASSPTTSRPPSYSGPTAAMIILNYKDADNVIRLVTAVNQYPEVTRIIVVDNCSPDDSLARLLPLESAKVIIMKSDRNGGYAYGNNFGVRILQERFELTDYLLVVNTDITVSRDCIAGCLAYLERHPRAGLAAPRMLNADGGPCRTTAWRHRSLLADGLRISRTMTTLFRKTIWSASYYDETELASEALPVDCVAGSFLAIRTTAFQEVGGFDNDTFLYYEEDILCWKLSRANWQTWLLGVLSYLHFGRASIAQSFDIFSGEKQVHKSKKHYHYQHRHRGHAALLFLDALLAIRTIEELSIVKSGFRGLSRLKSWLRGHPHQR